MTIETKGYFNFIWNDTRYRDGQAYFSIFFANDVAIASLGRRHGESQDEWSWWAQNKFEGRSLAKYEGNPFSSRKDAEDNFKKCLDDISKGLAS
ncbi:hypothetical protein GOZ89_12045 [Agrobacterium vitis]|uniref:hypothetical protein n=1 Tax=Agrobacterium vitis TaxID=373 RepID=UPI0012E8584D|nr:hypothetical protein [Agrobacterium vitis]MVA80149.1 hypothetical protein [Agrobacterium vitis]